MLAALDRAGLTVARVTLSRLSSDFSPRMAALEAERYLAEMGADTEVKAAE